MKRTTLIELLGVALIVAMFNGTALAQTIVVPALPGDYNQDGDVGAPDYTIFRDALGEVGNLFADGDGSGIVDAGDYFVWNANYGNTAAALASLGGGSGAVGPTATVVGTPNGGNIDWTVFYSPDPGLFSLNPAEDPVNPGGSLAVEMSFEMADGSLLPLTVAEDVTFADPLAIGVQPGNDPYFGGVVNGPQTYTGEATQLGGDSPTDAIFAPQGSTYFISGGPKQALTFTTSGLVNTVRFGGSIAQAGVAYPISGLVTVVPEPSSVAMVALAIGGALATRRWRSRMQ